MWKDLNWIDNSKTDYKSSGTTYKGEIIIFGYKNK